MDHLAGKRVLVTHADQPAGLACARACVFAGARVLAHYDPLLADGDALAQTLGVRRGDVIAADLHIPEHPIGLWNAALDRANRIDALVSVAGAYRPSFMNGGDLAWMESWRRGIQVNLTAPVDLCRAAEPHFRANGGGVAIILAPIAAAEFGSAADPACAAARGGLIAVCHTLSHLYRRANIAIYALSRDRPEASPAAEIGPLRDWVRGETFAGAVDAATTGELVARLCAGAAVADPAPLPVDTGRP